jgi:hypothetical protein
MNVTRKKAACPGTPVKSMRAEEDEKTGMLLSEHARKEIACQFMLLTISTKLC